MSAIAPLLGDKQTSNAAELRLAVNPCCLPTAKGRNGPHVNPRNSGIGNDGAAR